MPLERRSGRRRWNHTSRSPHFCSLSNLLWLVWKGQYSPFWIPIYCHCHYWLLRTSLLGASLLCPQQYRRLCPVQRIFLMMALKVHRILEFTETFRVPRLIKLQLFNSSNSLLHVATVSILRPVHHMTCSWCYGECHSYLNEFSCSVVGQQWVVERSMIPANGSGLIKLNVIPNRGLCVRTSGWGTFRYSNEML